MVFRCVPNEYHSVRYISQAITTSTGSNLQNKLACILFQEQNALVSQTACNANHLQPQQNVSNPCRVSSLSPGELRLFVTQRFDWVKTGGSIRRVNTRRQTDED